MTPPPPPPSSGFHAARAQAEQQHDDAPPHDEPEARAAAPWHSHLIMSSKGPRALLANALTALREAPEWQGRLWFDTFQQQTVLRGAAPWMTAAQSEQKWLEHFDARATEWLQHKGIMVGLETTGVAVQTVARERQFHPVMDFLERCRWDGDNRLDTWAITYLGSEDTPYCRAVAARWLISAVARVFEPGIKADCMLVLEGDQGNRKSAALNILAHPWFTDDLADIQNTKDAAMQLAGRWIVEVSELSSISRAEVEKVKAFLSRATDRFRPAYGRRVIELPRQSVFAGSANHNQYLRDETGNRRFWPITAPSIDLDGLTEMREQLWAEARDRYLASEHWWLDTKNLNSAAEEQQSARYLADVWQHKIEEYIVKLEKENAERQPENRREISISSILAATLHVPIDRQGQTEQNRVARALRHMGFNRIQIRDRLDNQRRRWVYRRPVTNPQSNQAAD
jgi:predicted P-loop ATPase